MLQLDVFRDVRVSESEESRAQFGQKLPHLSQEASADSGKYGHPA
jgi:hypothetical protein